MPGNDVLACWVRSQNVLPGQVGLPCLTQAEKTQHQSTWPCCMLLQHKPDPTPAYTTMLHVITTQARPNTSLHDHVIITTQARPSTSLHDHTACYCNTSPNFTQILHNCGPRSSFKLVIFTAYLSAANTQTIAVWHWSLSTAVCTVASHSCITIDNFCA